MLADEGADAHVHVDDRADRGPGLAQLGDLSDDDVVFGHDRVAQLDAGAPALADGEGVRPVGGGPEHHLGRFEHIVGVLLAQIQQLAQALVLLGGLDTVARGLLRLGQLGAQRLVFRHQGIVTVQIAVDAVKPVDRRADDLLHRREQNAGRVLHRADTAAAGRGAQGDQQYDGQHQDGHADAVFLQILFQSSSTPCFFSISPSRHSGRPITLKKSPSMPRTNSAALPCAP